MPFDPNANPEAIAARAAELALEQHDRLRSCQANASDPNKAGIEFYKHPFEIGISNNIASLMGAYAVLKGYVTPERAGITPA